MLSPGFEPGFRPFSDAEKAQKSFNASNQSAVLERTGNIISTTYFPAISRGPSPRPLDYKSLIKEKLGSLKDYCLVYLNN